VQKTVDFEQTMSAGDCVVVLRKWTPKFLRSLWLTQKFKRTIKPVLPQFDKKKIKKELLKERAPLSTTWSEKDVRYSYGMLTVVKKHKVPHLLKQWKRVMASAAVGGLSERQAEALFCVEQDQKVVEHVRSVLKDVSEMYGKDFTDLLLDLPFSCGRVSLPVAPIGKRKANDEDESNAKRFHAAWID